MKITKSQLKQLIKEELEQSIGEARDSAGNWKSRYPDGRSKGSDTEPETDQARKHRREKEERRRREREDLGYPPEKSKYFEEQEQLDEGVMDTIIKALQSPQVKEALKSIVLPIIQDNFPELAPKPVEPTPPRDAENPEPVIKKIRQ